MKRLQRTLLLSGWLILLGAVLGVGQIVELQEKVISVFDEASPAVVHITVRSTGENIFMQPVPVEGSGSGFLFDTEGHIVTNYHVIEGAEEITVAFGDVECCSAEVVGVDPSTDLAVIRVAREDLPRPLVLADSHALRVGQFVVAIGNPFGLEQTMTFGIVSALERVIQSPDGRFLGGAIQTDTSINPGNSGGPLLDLNGRVIGVASQIISPSRASAGIGFAIPANTVRRVVPVLIAEGEYPHPYLGITGFGLTPDVVQLFREAGIDLPLTRGVLITTVVEDGPAAGAGVRGGREELQIGEVVVPIGGDVLLSIDGVPVSSMLDVALLLDSGPTVGQTVMLRLERDGQEIVLPVVLGERPTGS